MAKSITAKPNTGLVMLELKRLSTNEFNPRKEIGDITELADSIRAKGVLQPLTVVPWYSMITGAPTPNDNQETDPLYTVVIGHRRLAAAKEAGLTELPCIVTEMTLAEQLEVMMSENMQRRDLTLYEEIKGFEQMSLFGESEEQISEHVGLSVQTVRKRLKLAVLPDDKLQTCIENQITLDELLQCTEIEDEKTRKKVMTALGTKNDRWELQSALRKQDSAKKTAEMHKWLNLRFLQMTHDEAKKLYKSDVSISANRPEEWAEQTTDGVKCWSVAPWNDDCAELWRERTDSEQSDAVDAARTAERRARLDELQEIAQNLRDEFVKNFGTSDEKLKNEVLKMAAAELMDTTYHSYNTALYKSLSNKKSPLQSLLAAWYASQPGKQAHSGTSLNDYYAKQLITVYKGLAKLGYIISDAEQGYLDGTHEAYGKQGDDDGKK